MFGRFALKATPEELKALFGYLDAEDLPPRYMPDPVGELLRPAPDALMEGIPVGDTVNNADNDGPDLLKPIAANDDTAAPPLFSR